MVHIHLPRCFWTVLRAHSPESAPKGTGFFSTTDRIEADSIPRRTSLKLISLTVVTAFLERPLEAFTKRRKNNESHATSLDVPPSPAIEERVAEEVAKAKQILSNLSASNFLASPYLVSAVYYHDDFLTDFPVDRTSADPERRIIGHISKLISPELKVRFVRLLHEAWDHSRPTGSAQLVKPVNYRSSSGGRRSHKFAIDLFAAEGSAVHSASRGIVVLVDRNWTAADLFSTTSRKGGNAVIVFAPDEDRFYRYCHLNAVMASPGQMVAPGQTIGTVGHTGLNASRPGHGGHLHFEANEYRDGHVRAMDYRRLRGMLDQWPTSSN